VTCLNQNTIGGKMKKQTTMLLIILAIFSGSLFSQEHILDVPPLFDGNKPALAHYIVNDTTETGERVDPERVYRLERDAIYVLDYGMTIDFSLRLIAAEGKGHLPLIAPEYSAAGEILGFLFEFTSNSEEHSFTDILFQRVNLDRAFTVDFLRGFVFKGDSSRIEFQGCIFNAFTGGGIINNGKHNSIFISDCNFRNGEWPNHPFIGQQCYFGNANPIDTLSITNSTYFNNNSYLLAHDGALQNYLVFEHNTIYTSLIDAVRLNDTWKGNIRSNLYYGYASYGDADFIRASTTWYTFGNGEALSTIYIEPIARRVLGSRKEEDRIINVSHNAYFMPPEIAADLGLRIRL